jgi:hypothetical protein
VLNSYRSRTESAVRACCYLLAERPVRSAGGTSHPSGRKSQLSFFATFFFPAFIFSLLPFFPFHFAIFRKVKAL